MTGEGGRGHACASVMDGWFAPHAATLLQGLHRDSAWAPAICWELMDFRHSSLTVSPAGDCLPEG